MTITQKLVKFKINILRIMIMKYITTQVFNKLASENFTARLAQANLASKRDIANFVKKADFDNKLKKVYLK